MKPWIDPDTGRASCPECYGFGYDDDDSDEGHALATFVGVGVASLVEASVYLNRRAGEYEGTV